MSRVQVAGHGAEPEGFDPAPASARLEPVPHRPVHPPRLIERWDAWRLRIEALFRARDLVPDLAEDIGSARWFRGFGTMVALAALAFAFWPNFEPVEAAPLSAIDDGARREFKALAIRPLAFGGDNGRHMIATEAVVPLAAAPERPSIQLVATLGDGDSFGRMLQRAGVGSGDAARVAELVNAAVPLGEIAPGTRFDITLGKRDVPALPRPLDAISFRARFDTALSVERRGGALVLGRTPIMVDTTPLRIRGIVGSSLYRSARAAGAPSEAVQQYLRTIDQYVSFEEISPSDEFDLVVSYKRAGDGEAQAGQLLYAGVVHDGKPSVQLLRWGPDGEFYSLGQMSGQATSSDSAMLGAPVAGHVTSTFGMRRHPILGFVRMHAGIDFGAPWGSPIYAVTDGVVSYAGWHGGHGNYVRLEHGGGIGTGYGHMSRIAVAPGMRVQRGQVIGYVGSSGLSTGPHLHYELYRNGQTVDPMSVRFVTRAAQVDPGQLAGFKARLAQMLGLRPGAALAKVH